MIADERLAAYINSLDTGNTEILDTIEREAKAAGVPGKKAVKKEMQRISFDLVDHQGFEPQTP